MNDLELVGKIPAAAKKIGESITALNEANKLIVQVLKKQKEASEAILASSEELKTAMDELRERAGKVKQSGGK